jgi:hypothetical protein
LVITNLLALTVFMLLVAEIMPSTSEVVPLISIYYTCTIMEVWSTLDHPLSLYKGISFHIRTFSFIYSHSLFHSLFINSFISSFQFFHIFVHLTSFIQLYSCSFIHSCTLHSFLLIRSYFLLFIHSFPQTFIY